MNGRTAGILAMALLAAPSACGTANRPTCDALIRCVGVMNPFLLAPTDADFGADGACWDTDSRETCEAVCAEQLVALWIPSGVDACDPGPVTGEWVLSEPQFLERFNTLWCDAYDDCTNGAECFERDVACSGGRFDPEAAQACLDVGGVQCREDRFYYPDACESYCSYDDND